MPLVSGTSHTAFVHRSAPLLLDSIRRDAVVASARDTAANPGPRLRKAASDKQSAAHVERMRMGWDAKTALIRAGLKHPPFCINRQIAKIHVRLNSFSRAPRRPLALRGSDR
jgi:hypothetical protein